MCIRDRLSKDDLLGRISWEALTGELPEDFTFSADGENYTLTPVGGYEEGCLYRVTIPEGMLSLIHISRVGW